MVEVGISPTICQQKLCEGELLRLKFIQIDIYIVIFEIYIYTYVWPFCDHPIRLYNSNREDFSIIWMLDIFRCFSPSYHGYHQGCLTCAQRTLRPKSSRPRTAVNLCSGGRKKRQADPVAWKVDLGKSTKSNVEKVPSWERSHIPFKVCWGKMQTSSSIGWDMSSFPGMIFCQIARFESLESTFFQSIKFQDSPAVCEAQSPTRCS